MNALFRDYGMAVSQALSSVFERARKPSPRVARHWESTDRITWFGACADHHFIYASWSFGRLRDVQDDSRHSVGVFALTQQSFPEIDDAQIRALGEALIPATADGPTRVFLQRVAAQMAVADFLLTLPGLWGCEVALFARPDAVEKVAQTPQWPMEAKGRLLRALDEMDPAFTHCDVHV